MKLSWILSAVFLLVAVAAGVIAGFKDATAVDSSGPSFEVWAFDQSDTQPDGGGLLYIWDGGDISHKARNATPEIIDLAQAAAEAECSVATRPHMAATNHSSPPSHVVLANVVSPGKIFFIGADSREVEGCVSGVGNSHAAIPTPDDSMVIVDDIAGQSLHKIETDYQNNSYTLVETLPLAPFGDALGTPGNARPICHEYTADSAFAYVTMGGGGVLVVDVGSSDGTTTPMSVAHVYPATTAPGIGCGVFPLPDGRMLTNGESGAAGGDDFLYIFDTSGAADGDFPDPVQIELPGEDTHGISVCENHQGGFFALTAMRVSNDVTIVDLQTHEVIQSRTMARGWSPDPKPDVTGMMGNKMFAALRGPKPLSAITALENAERTPGVAVLTINQNCNSFQWDVNDLASMKDETRTTNLADGTEVTAADPHGLVVVVRE